MRVPPRGVALFALAAAWLAALPGCVYAPFDLGLDTLGQLSEATLIEGAGDDKLLVLRIDGEITDRPSEDGLLGPVPSTTSIVRAALDLARRDEAVKGVLVRVNSPGGGVTASDLCYRELNRYRKDTGHPVVAYFMDTAASGGYYLAQAADRIVAAPTCVTGSIGVIAMFPNVSGLGQKIGVDVHAITSGPNKDAGNPFRPMQPGERALLQGLIDNMYARFVDVVAEGRKRGPGRKGLTRAEVTALADGRVFTATEAKHKRLVDEVGYLEDALADLSRLARVKDARVIAYEPRVLGGTRPTVYSERAVAAPLQPMRAGSGGGDLNLVKLSTGAERRAHGPVLRYMWAPGL